jgi:phosphohistidine phosphatase
MSRELWLLRHGKAERFDASEDYDRALKKRGKRDAKRIGRWMEARGLLPDVIISSPATRAIETAKIVCYAIGWDRHNIQQEKRLYDEGIVRVKSVLADCPADLGRVLLVGHNPELEDLLTFLVVADDLPEVDKVMPTAGFVGLIMPDDWSKLEQGCGKLLEAAYPKALLKKEQE